MFYELCDYPDPAHCPLWALGTLKYQQDQKLKHSPAFDIQVELTKEFYETSDCSILFDIGCWLGVLGFKLHQAIKPETMVMVDAIPLYLKLTRELFLSRDIRSNIVLGGMVVHADPPKFNRYFRVDLSNTINTSNILVKQAQLADKICVELPTSVALTPVEAAKKLAEFCSGNFYLKIDIDSVDHLLLEAVLAAGLRPSALNIENLAYDLGSIKIFNTVIKMLAENGYKVPNRQFALSNNYMMYDLFCSSNAWKIMAYGYQEDAPGVHLKDVITESNIDRLLDPQL